MKPKRILLKLSGETLSGESGPLDAASLALVASEIKDAASNAAIAVVVGGGNIWRGGRQTAIERAAADYIGMYATVVNALAVKEALAAVKVPSAVVSALSDGPSLEADSCDNVRGLLSGGKVVIFAGGTGRPFFTTDTAAASRALEIGADLLVKATQVDGVYDSDPRKNPSAKKYENVTFDEAIAKRLGIMDAAAFALCREGNLPVLVYDFALRGGLSQIVAGKKIGTLVTASPK
ncbi:MAG: UMP kinase [Elusimicrobia bacterium HGW-Elusimicrobia-1]|jgi:uridylate kinase|nr:MAG: UMP kinase [Elusimicrobia bacterium HGW-Elusimicrobia-1]